MNRKGYEVWPGVFVPYSDINLAQALGLAINVLHESKAGLLPAFPQQFADLDRAAELIGALMLKLNAETEVDDVQVG